MHKGILLGHEKEQNIAIYSNMDGSRDYHTKWNQSDRKILYHLYVESQKIKQMNFLTKQK